MKHFFIALSLLLLAASGTTAGAQQTGAKVIFSKTIDGPEASSFTSADYIYARIVATGTSLDQYFSILANQSKFPSLRTKVWINFNGTNMQGHPFEYLWLQGIDSTKSVYHFDILPDPALARSVIASVPDFNYVLSNSTFANSIGDRVFSKEGVYTVEISIIGETKDAWGKKGPDVVLKGSFKFDFKFADIARLKANTKSANEMIKSKTFVLDKLPAVYAKNIQSKDPKLTRAKIAAILKRDMPGTNILKFAIGEHTSTWAIMKNELGLPRYRYFVGDILIIYKDGNVCKSSSIYLKEDYEGGGRYGTLRVGGGGGSDTQLILCDAVK